VPEGGALSLPKWRGDEVRRRVKTQKRLCSGKNRFRLRDKARVGMIAFDPVQKLFSKS
jgi:hypothetical protein